MKAEIKRRDSSYVRAWGAVQSGEFDINLIPETDAEQELALELHRNIEGIRSLPPGSADTHVRTEPLQHMKPDIRFVLTVSLPPILHRGR